jgi:hypothetical protein
MNRKYAHELKAGLLEYTQTLENDGDQVHLPCRDTDQDDPIGFAICQENLEAIINSDEIHIAWDPTSRGSVFDLGMAFALNTPIKIIWKYSAGLSYKPGKCFENMIKRWEQQTL